MFPINHVAQIPSRNNQWCTVLKEYGFDRIAKADYSATWLIGNIMYRFTKNSIIRFYVYNNFVDLVWYPLDIIDIKHKDSPFIFHFDVDLRMYEEDYKYKLK